MCNKASRLPDLHPSKAAPPPLAPLGRVGVRARGVEHGAAREAVARAGDDVAPRRAVAVARQVNFELGVAVAAVLEALRATRGISGLRLPVAHGRNCELTRDSKSCSPLVRETGSSSTWPQVASVKEAPSTPT